jgi:hypothetical protein
MAAVVKQRGIVDAWSNVKFFGIYKNPQGESSAPYIDDTKKTYFGDQRHVYEDVILERAPVMHEGCLEETVFDFKSARNASFCCIRARVSYAHSVANVQLRYALSDLLHRARSVIPPNKRVLVDE